MSNFFLNKINEMVDIPKIHKDVLKIDGGIYDGIYDSNISIN
jgi:hypothetical protein